MRSIMLSARKECVINSERLFF